MVTVEHATGTDRCQKLGQSEASHLDVSFLSRDAAHATEHRSRNRGLRTRDSWSKVAVVCLMGDSEPSLDADEKTLREMLWRDVLILEPFEDGDGDDDGDNVK